VDCVLGSSLTLRPVIVVLLRPGSGAWQSTPPVTWLWPSARAAELGKRSLQRDSPLRLSISAGGLAIHGAD
jgi:hypothetical protein